MRLPWLRRAGVEVQPLSARDAYALWSETYPPRPHNPLMEIEQSIVGPMIAALAPSRALDVGTGTGRCRTLMRSAGARVVVGVDQSLPMLERGVDRTASVCGDACGLPFADCRFDLVCASLMAGDLPEVSLWIREAARVLIPGGHLIYSDFHPSWAARRWRRTFETQDGRELEIAYFPHAIDEHLTGLEHAGFDVKAIREPRHPSRPDPIVAIFHAVKRRKRSW